MIESKTSTNIFTLLEDGSWLVVLDDQRYHASNTWEGLWAIQRILQTSGVPILAVELMGRAHPPDQRSHELRQEFVDAERGSFIGSQPSDGGAGNTISKRIKSALEAMKTANPAFAKYFGTNIVETKDGWKYIGDRQWQFFEMGDVHDLPKVALRRESPDLWIISCNGRELKVRHCLGLQYIDLLVRNAGRSVPSARLRQQGNPHSTTAVTEDEIFEIVVREQFSVLVEQAQELMQEFCPAGDVEDDFQGMTATDISIQLAEIEKQAKQMAIEARVKKDERKFQHYLKALKELDVVRKRMGELQKRRSDFQASNRMARSGVAHAVKLAVQKIADEDPEIGKFLADRIRTGDDCVFTMHPASELKNASCEAR